MRYSISEKRLSGALFAGAMLLAGVIAGCTDSSSPSANVVGTPVDASTAGSIEVEVSFDGALPVPKLVDMRTVPQCAAAHPEPVYDESLLVKDGKVANAVVYIKSGFKDWVFSTPSEPVVVDQVGCLYQPRVAAAMVGQVVRFRNSDPEAHNVHGRPQVVGAWNFIMSRPGATRDLVFDKPEVAVPIGCDVHPWMSGFLAVLPNPYFAVTGSNGKARIKDIPPGELVIAVWHEKLGTREFKLPLEPRGALSLPLRFGSAG